MNQVIRWTTRLLAGLWILDGVLQLQPPMFTHRFVTSVFVAATVGQPRGVDHLLFWGIHLWTQMPVAADVMAAGLQVAIGVMLWSGRWRRVGLCVSMAWGIGVWVMGEGLGGLLAPGSSILTGLPGSAIMYVLLSGVLLQFESQRILRSLRWGLTGFWALGAGYQIRPLFWHSGFLSRELLMVAQTPSPAFLTGPIRGLASVAFRAPIATNGILVAVFLGLAVWSLVAHSDSRSWAITSVLVLLAIWWFGMDFGVFGGVGTDPNTAPLVALAVAFRYYGGRAVIQRRRVTSKAGSHDGPGVLPFRPGSQARQAR